MGKSKSTQQQSNQYQYVAPPVNPYYETAKGLIEGYDGGAAGVREGYSRNINDINESGNSFMGAKTPDYVRDKVKQSRLFRNNMDLGRGLSDAKQNEVAYKNSAYMSLGGATAPQLVQSGSSGSGSQTQAPIQTISQIGQLAAA